MDKAGIYTDIPLTEYVNDPAPEPSLNASIATTLLTATPAHAFMQHPRLSPQEEREESSRLDFGTIAHALLLEDDESRVVAIEADDWKKKDTREQRDAARAGGKLPILAADFETVQTMVNTAKTTIGNSEVAADFESAIPEQTLIWQEADIWLRCRPDKATPDWRVVFDYKTCAGTAHPAVWAKSAMVRYGYDIQAAINLRGVKALGLAKRTTFIFLVQEMEPPYALSIVSLAPSWLTLADDKLRVAMSIWQGCTRKNEWPGYPSRIAYVDPPAFASMDWDACLPDMDAEDFI